MPEKKERLKKSLGLFNVFAICTAPMFSSGFFLLPGLAYAETGPSVLLAYLTVSILIIPSLLSKAELSTAMYRAGGTYYFIDRALGPLAGTIGGISIWLTLILKSSFAFIGIGAYLTIFADVEIVPIAVALTLVFGILNYVGVKKSAGIQNILISLLMAILSYYIVYGLIHIGSLDFLEVHRHQLTSFFKKGGAGFFGTVGMIFVSYAGITKVASVAEEVKNPDKNIPLGMALSLGVATFVYLVGIYIMVILVDSSDLAGTLTPVVAAAREFFVWLPEGVNVIIVAGAAIIGFVGTGNAGILSASRYPLAMARDRIFPLPFATINRFKTPSVALICTVAFMIAVIVFLNVKEVAKLASAFQLLVFAIINLVVIVMRESRIWSYTPGFQSPLYPWMQLFGFFASLLVLVEIGILSLLFTLGIVVCSLIWYFWYVQEVEREGAIFHLFARLGKYRFDALNHELKEIMMERELYEQDPYEGLLARAEVKDFRKRVSFEELVEDIAKDLAQKSPYEKSQLKEIFMHGQHIGGVSMTHGTAIIEVRLNHIKESELYLVRSVPGFRLDLEDVGSEELHSEEPLDALVFLISPQSQSGQHLRILSELVSRVEEEEFLKEWHKADSKRELSEVFMRHERYVGIKLLKQTPAEVFIGLSIKDVKLPGNTLITVIHRDGDVMVPSADQVLKENDRIMVIGDKKDIASLYDRYVKKD